MARLRAVVVTRGQTACGRRLLEMKGREERYQQCRYLELISHLDADR